jgi:transposase-like protein
MDGVTVLGNGAAAGAGEAKGAIATGAQPAPGAAARPDPEVPSKARRRRFTAEYKLRILREAERCTTSGAIGALLRREGLYSSHLTTWRQQQAKALQPRRRGRKLQANPLRARVAQLERENARLQRELEKAEIIIDVQKKVAKLLGKDGPSGSSS